MSGTRLCAFCFQSVKEKREEPSNASSITNFVNEVEHFLEFYQHCHDNPGLSDIILKECPWLGCCENCKVIVNSFRVLNYHLKCLEMRLEEQLNLLVKRMQKGNRIPTRVCRLNEEFKKRKDINCGVDCQAGRDNDMDNFKTSRNNLLTKCARRVVRSQPVVLLEQCRVPKREELEIEQVEDQDDLCDSDWNDPDECVQPMDMKIDIASGLPNDNKGSENDSVSNTCPLSENVEQESQPHAPFVAEMKPEVYPFPKSGDQVAQVGVKMEGNNGDMNYSDSDSDYNCSSFSEEEEDQDQSSGESAKSSSSDSDDDTGPWPRPCPQPNCKLTLTSKILLKAHLTLHGQFPCQVCSVVKDFAPHLALHELQHAHKSISSQNPKSFQCPRCPPSENGLDSKVDYIQHFLSI